MKKIMYTSWFCLLAGCMLMISCTTDGGNEAKTAKQMEADSLVDQLYERYDAFDFAGTVEIGEEALMQLEALGDTTTMSDIMATMCISYLRVGDIAKGLELSARAIEIDSILGDPELLSGDYNTVAGLYLAEDKAEKAEPFIIKAIEYEMKTPDGSRLSNRYGIASEIYCKIHQPQKALDFAQKGLAIAEQHGDSAQMGTRLSQLGDAFMASGQMQEAEETFLRCAEILKATQSAVSLAIVYRQLGNIYEDRNQIPLAISYYEKAANLARQLKYSMLLCQCTQAIGELTAGEHPDYSVQMLMESRQLADTLHSQNVEKMMADFATKFDLKEKEHTIEEQAAELRMHRFVTVIFVVGSVVALAILALVLYMRRLRRKGEVLEVKLSEKVVQETQHQEEPEMSQSDREFIERLAQHVEQHLGDADLSSTSIADAFCLSPRQFARRVKTLTGVDTTHYIRASRILRARQLLTHTELPMGEICMQCGFDSPNYFSRTFRSDVGLSPTEYRKKTTENK